MLLVVEVGNSNTKIGVFEGSRLRVSWRLTSRREQTADEYGVFIQTLLGTRGIEPADVREIAMSNVVPTVEQTLETMCKQYFGVTPFSLAPGVNTGMPILVDQPREVGPDRLADAVAAFTLYGGPAVVVNFGTATTFDCVSVRGEFVGGAIAPGLATAMDALMSRAARLYRVELTRPKEAIGRNTVTNIQSGMVYGFAGLVDGLVERMSAELDGEPQVVATGGLATLIAGVAKCIRHVNADLTLEGVRLIYERSRA